ncbi:MFS transporter [Candidatus Woesearchaeota archaeon]|nr:MFS transporter [Candidatus Woesearchaeota archaeon]
MKRQPDTLNPEQKRVFLETTGLMTVYYFGIFLFIPLLAPYVATLGLDKFQIGLLFATYPLMSYLTSTIVGALSDETGRRRIILAGLALEALVITFYLYDKTWWMFLIARAIDAISFSAVILVGLSAIEDRLNTHNRGTYAGLSLSLLHLGKLLGPPIGGLLADVFFIKMPFIVGGAVVSLLLVLFYLKTRPKQITDRPQRLSSKSFNVLLHLRWFLQERRLILMAILGIAMHARLPLTTIFIPLFIKEHFGLSYTFIGIAAFCMELPQLFQFVYSRVGGRFPRHHLVLFGTVLYGVALALLSAAPTYGTFITALILVGIGAGSWNIGAWTLMADIGEQQKKIGSVVCSYSSIARIGELLSTIVSGYVALRLGTDTLILLNGIIVITVSGLSYHWLKE